MGSSKHTARIGKPVRACATYAADSTYSADYGVKEVKSFRFQVEFTLY